MSNAVHLRDGEVLVYRAHLHWSWILPVLLRALGASLLFAGLVYWMSDYFLNTTAGTLIILLYTLLVLCYIFINRTIHHMSYLAVTSHRVLRVDRHKILHGKIAEMPFDRIENVQSSVHGFWGTLLKFGTIEIYTAGGEGQIVVGHHLVDPAHVASIILKTREDYLKKAKLFGTDNYRHKNSVDNHQQRSTRQYDQSTDIQNGVMQHSAVGKSSKIKCKESYLVKLLAESDGFEKNVVGSLVDELGGGGETSKRGRRLVSSITSNDYFKRKIVDDLTNELLG